MKKIILIVLILIPLQELKAQDVPFFDFGVKAGVNASWLRGISSAFEDEPPESNLRFGYQAGLFARIKLPILGLHLQPELLISQLNSKFTTVVLFDDIVSDQTFKFNYFTLDIPLLLGKRIPIGPVALRIQAGPVPSIILKARSETSGGFLIIEKEIDLDRFAINLQAGVGVDISKVSFDLRYQHGFSEVNQGSALFGQTQNVSALLLTLGVKII